jgi:hypothetical protein
MLRDVKVGLGADRNVTAGVGLRRSVDGVVSL